MGKRKSRTEETLTTTSGRTNFQNKTGNPKKLTIQILAFGALLFNMEQTMKFFGGSKNLPSIQQLWFLSIQFYGRIQGYRWLPQGSGYRKHPINKRAESLSRSLDEQTRHALWKSTGINNSITGTNQLWSVHNLCTFLNHRRVLYKCDVAMCNTAVPREGRIKMFLKRLQRSNGGRSKQLHRENKSKKPAECKHTTHTNTHALSCSTSVSSSVRPGHVLSFLICCCLHQTFLCLLICCVIIFTPTVEHLQQTPPR